MDLSPTFSDAVRARGFKTDSTIDCRAKAFCRMAQTHDQLCTSRTGRGLLTSLSMLPCMSPSMYSLSNISLENASTASGVQTAM